jgi:hypothetical protein
MEDFGICVSREPAELLTLDEALDKLIAEDPAAGEVARLRLFTGITLAETALALGISKSSAYRQWTFARAFLQHELRNIE